MSNTSPASLDHNTSLSSYQHHFSPKSRHNTKTRQDSHNHGRDSITNPSPVADYKNARRQRHEQLPTTRHGRVSLADLLQQARLAERLVARQAAMPLASLRSRTQQRLVSRYAFDGYSQVIHRPRITRRSSRILHHTFDSYYSSLPFQEEHALSP